jgi:hypothetical protein
MRFAPPITPGSAGSAAARPVDKPDGAQAASPVEDAPAAPDRGRWGNLPAPWEPLPDWACAFEIGGSAAVTGSNRRACTASVHNTTPTGRARRACG